MNQKWDEVAKQMGFDSPNAMWRAMYATHSIAELAKKLSVSIHTVRLQLAENGVEVRSRGGPNYVKADFSDVTEEDIREKGIRAIAREKGVTPTAAYKRLIYSKGRHLRQGPTAPQDAVVLRTDPEEPSPAESR